MAVLLLAGCSQSDSRTPGQAAIEAADNADIRSNPVGRFQIVSDQKGGVYRLDTRYGNLSHCSENQTGTVCDPGTRAP